jgi:hypothetical protein
LQLSLSVALGGFGMRAPVGFLIIGVVGAPLLAALQKLPLAGTGIGSRGFCFFVDLAG